MSSDPISPRPAVVATEAVIDRDNPWPGLAPFTEDQSAFFYGRDEEIRTLTRLMERKALTILFGQSGLGKSSLLQAGVFPRLRAASFLPIYIRLDHNGGAPSPTEQVKAMVATAAQGAGTWTRPGSAKPGETLWEFFHHRDDRLVDAGGRTIVPVLVFDQFEELFTLGAAAGAQRDRAVAFMSELAELVENRPSEQLVARLDRSAEEMEAFDFSRTDYRVCISLREDYLPHLEGLKTIMPALMENRMRLTRMSGTQALDAVLKPGAGLVSGDVARIIVEFVSGARGGSAERLAELDVEPPLLSVICRELNERRRALGQAQITADLVTGNRREILHDFYERSVADLPEGMRRFVEDKLLTKSGFRDNLALETALEEPGVTKPLIDTLVSRRLLRIEDRIGAQRVELTHDVLADVVRASRDARQQRLALGEAARHTRRQRWIIAGLATAVAGLLVGAFFGIRAQRSSAAQASQTDYVLGSRLLDDGRLSEGLAYLVRAGRKDPKNPLIAPRLLSVLASHNFAFPVGSPLKLPSPGAAATFTADGHGIFVQGLDDVVRLIDTDTWRIDREYAFPQKVRPGGIAVPAQSGDLFAAVFVDNSIHVVERMTGQERVAIVPPERIAGRSPVFGFSPDGHWLAAAGGNSLWVWDSASGKLLTTLLNNSYYRQFAFSPDGRSIVTTHDNKTQIWSLPDGAPMGAAVDNPGIVFLAEFSRDGRRLLIGNIQGALVVDVRTGVPVRPVIPISAAALYDLWITPDGQRLVFTASDRTANVLDVATGKPVFPAFVHGGNAQAGEIVANGQVLFTNSVDGLFRLWDLETGKLLAEPTARQPHFSPTIVSRDGQTVAMFSEDGQAYRFRLGHGPARPLALARTPETTTVVNFAQGTPARVAWMTHTELRVMNLASGHAAPGGFRLPTRVISLSRSGSGGTLGAGDPLLLQTAPGVWRALTIGDAGVANDVPLSPAPAIGGTAAFNLPRRLAAAGATQQTVGVWDLKTGRRILEIKSEAPVRFTAAAIGFSPDGTRVVYSTAGDSVFHVCEVDGGKELFHLQLTGRAALRTIRFSSDGSRLVTGDDWGAVHVWDAATGKLLRSNQRHRTTVTRFDFSNDGRYYVSLSTDGSVQVWDAANDQPIGELLEQPGGAGRADFSPDGTRLVTSASSGSARVWDVLTGLPVTEAMSTGGDRVNIVAYSPDGAFIDQHGDATTPFQHVRFWSVPPASPGLTPDWLLTLATICGGQTLSTEGKYLDATPEFARIDDVQRALAAAPAADALAGWGRWILSDDRNRPIAPGFTITPAEAEKLRDEFAAPSKSTTASAW